MGELILSYFKIKLVIKITKSITGIEQGPEIVHTLLTMLFVFSILTPEYLSLADLEGHPPESPTSQR